MPEWKHLAPDSGPLGRYRGRRRRGTRIAVNWKYNFRAWATLALLPLFAFFGGVDLLSRPSAAQQAAGAAVLIATGVAVVGFVRWLLRPVDPESRRARDVYYESMRWRNFWKDLRGKE